MRIKTFPLSRQDAIENLPLEERVDEWLEGRDVVEVEITTSLTHLIIFYKVFTPQI